LSGFENSFEQEPGGGEHPGEDFEHLAQRRLRELSLPIPAGAIGSGVVIAAAAVVQAAWSLKVPCTKTQGDGRVSNPPQITSTTYR
jgi:hypothetical protein